MRLCSTKGCYEYANAPRCNKCARASSCEKCGHLAVRSGLCARHLPANDVQKYRGRWRTCDEVKEYLQKRPELRGAQWRLETLWREVPSKGVDDKGVTVDTGKRLTQFRRRWLVTLGTFEALVWADLDWQ